MNAAVRYWSLVALRRNLRGVVVLAVLIGLGAGGAMAASAGARRSHSAMQRLVAMSDLPDAYLVAEDPLLVATASRLPQVVAAQGQFGVLLQPEGAPCNEASENYYPIAVPTFGRPYRDVDRPRLVAGRLPNQSNPNEVALAEQHARRLGLGVGDHFRLKAFDESEESVSCDADTSVADLEIVGVVRHVSELGAKLDQPVVQTYLTKAFGRDNPDLYARSHYHAALVRLERGEQDLATFRRAAGRLGVDVEPLGAQLGSAPVQASLDAIAVGLWAFAGVLGTVAVIAIGVGLARQIATVERDLSVLCSLGLGRGRAALAASVLGIASGLGGTSVAAVVAVGLSRLHLIGLASRTEPQPGFALDAEVLVAGTMLTAGAVLALSAWGAWRAVARGTSTSSGPPARPGLVTRLQAAGAPPWASIGAAYALGRTGRAARLPNRLALVATTAGVGGVVAVLVFGAGLHHAQTDPTVYGWGSWDATMAGGPEDGEFTVDALAENPRVAGVALMRARFGLELDGHRLLGVELSHQSGDAGPTLVRGRFPRGTDEIALGEDTADDLDVRVGEHVAARGPRGRRNLAVVGIAGFPGFDGDALARGFLVRRQTTAALGFSDECNSNDCFQNLVVSWRDGTNVGAEVRRARREGVDVERPDAGAEVRRLNEVDSLPRALALGVALLGTIGLVHTLTVTLVRRRKELAVTRALGFTRADVRRVSLVQGLVIGILSAAGGGVAGVLIGRIAWSQAADALGIPRGLPVSLSTVLFATASSVAFCVLLAVAVSMTATSAQPAAALREEKS